MHAGQTSTELRSGPIPLVGTGAADRAHPGPHWLAAMVSTLFLVGACHSADSTGPRPEVPVARSLVPGPSPALSASLPLAVSFDFMTLPLARAFDVNDNEVVVGDIGSNNIAAYWTQATGLVVLGQVGTGSTGCCSFLFDLNENDEAAGTSSLGAGIALTRWTLAGNSYVDLPTGFGRNFAQAINDHGEITAVDDAGGGRPYFRSASGGITPLQVAPAFFSGWSTDLNNAGVISGFLFLVPTGYRAVAWPDATSAPVDLGTLGGNQSTALGLNNAGDVVGWSEVTAGDPARYATLWPASGGIVDLRSWPNPCPGQSEAAEVSDIGIIVGRCNGLPVLWTAVEGMRYLPLPPGSTSGEPRAINTGNMAVGIHSGGGILWRPATTTPVASAGGPYAVVEGSPLTLDGSASSDPGGGALDLAWNFGDGNAGSGATPVHAYADNGVFPVTVTVTNQYGVSTMATTTAVVSNAAPVIVSLSGPEEPIGLTGGQAVATFNATFTDAGVADTHTADITCDGGSADPAQVEEAGGAGSVTVNCRFSAAGVYQVVLTVRDDDGDSAAQTWSQYVVVYDPSGGFVTGGGWIDSAPGAFPASPDLGGRAVFGFVSRYQKGATVPTGNTEFHFQAGGLSFSSVSYQWLVVAGAKAQYKGTGRVNGNDGYGFLATATDGQLSGGGGVDRFRMKIWSLASGVVVYDNVMGDPDDVDSASPQTLGGGSISIKK